MEKADLKRFLRGRLATVLIVSGAVGLLVLLQALKHPPSRGFEERVLVAAREIPAGTRIDLADFQAVPLSRIEPIPRAGAAVNDQQLHLVSNLRAQTRIARRGLLLWADLGASSKEPPKGPGPRQKIEVFEEQ